MILSNFQHSPAVTSERVNKDLPLDSIARSYFLMRLIIGILGVALPILLIVGDAVLLRTNFSDILARGSLSAYYHSSMRDVFVIIMAMTGLLLFTYKSTERTHENIYSYIAGFAALIVALIPTHIPDDGSATLTGVQHFLTEQRAAIIHYVAAATFVTFLGFICSGFSARERKAALLPNISDEERRKYAKWSFIHAFATLVIFVSIAFIVLTQWLRIWDSHSILHGETIIALAFGTSWILKSASMKLLPKMTDDGVYPT